MNTAKSGGPAALVALTVALVFSTANAQEQQTTVRWGPIELPAATAEGPGEKHNEVAGASDFSKLLIGLFTSVADYAVTKPCQDCYITSIEPNLVLADGSIANFNNGTMLHHVVNMNFSRPDVTCRPNIFSDKPIQRLGGLSGGNERFFAAGNERTRIAISGDYGYFVGEGDDWGLVYHLMNMSPQPKTVYFEYKFTWVDAEQVELDRVRPIWIDIDQCGYSEYEVPAGYSDIEWAWEADRSHKVTDIGGHLHNYGLSIAWRNETTGDNLCTSVAGYAPGSSSVPVGSGTGADAAHPLSVNTVTSDPLGLGNYNGNISDMTVCHAGDSGPGVSKGDLMQTHAQIYRPNATDHDMGIMIGFMDEEFCITNYWCF
ncbi:hypothetical protein [Microbulbifer rhizosphaerae]|uniref:Uncharacterized protein n=1 Tax=Microbulbifer rhizosphaerae TaxID=1562603 RepID=A0A7W4ZCS1_9GAMM|nr:hypothetical protein [Microbulbifer rhizosphaerae]MBB3063610.1 hypothetical protein [Microbulbifer rhizosphaerae]